MKFGRVCILHSVQQQPLSASKAVFGLEGRRDKNDYTKMSLFVDNGGKCEGGTF